MIVFVEEVDGTEISPPLPPNACRLLNVELLEVKLKAPI